ncbi:MAG: hypothetical protein HY278_00160 [candidate division NC10 bacterium]|nr:hypothetical protein [candidate division NC10 bacterium]
MNTIIERFKDQRVIIHMAANWRIVGTVITLEDDVVELADDEGASIFVNMASIVAIEPYRQRGGVGHYI